MEINADKFEVLKEFTGNKLSRVFLIEHRETGKNAVLKEVKIVNREKQKLEVQIHSKLNHRYIIRLIDYKVNDDSITMLLEYAKHGDLFGLLPRLAASAEEKVLRIFHGVVEAVNYLHQLGYVHRDIKPENILLTSGMRPKLADFGSSAAQKAIRNTFCGTFEYMAPEIYLRDGQSAKVDVWALGVLLYELFHGATPFKRDTLTTIKAKLEKQNIEFKVGLSEGVRALICQMLSFEPAKRPSCAQIIAAPLFDAFRTPSDGRRESDETIGSLKELREALLRVKAIPVACLTPSMRNGDSLPKFAALNNGISTQKSNKRELSSPSNERSTRAPSKAANDRLSPSDCQRQKVITASARTASSRNDGSLKGSQRQFRFDASGKSLPNENSENGFATAPSLVNQCSLEKSDFLTPQTVKGITETRKAATAQRIVSLRSQQSDLEFKE